MGYNTAYDVEQFGVATMYGDGLIKVNSLLSHTMGMDIGVWNSLFYDGTVPINFHHFTYQANSWEETQFLGGGGKSRPLPLKYTLLMASFQVSRGPVRLEGLHVSR